MRSSSASTVRTVSQTVCAHMMGPHVEKSFNADNAGTLRNLRSIVSDYCCDFTWFNYFSNRIAKFSNQIAVFQIESFHLKLNPQNGSNRGVNPHFNWNLSINTLTLCWRDAKVRSPFLISAVVRCSQLPFSTLILWYGVRNSIQTVRNWVMRCWCGCLSAVRYKWFVYGPADDTTTPSSLASLKSRMALPFWWRLTQAVLEKRPLNKMRVLGVANVVFIHQLKIWILSTVEYIDTIYNT